MRIALLATLDTKSEEVGYFSECVSRLGLDIIVVDIGLRTENPLLSGNGKVLAMERAAHRSETELRQLILKGKISVLVGMGGGTGAQIAVSVLNSIGEPIPKMLITTMASDPRKTILDDSIVIIPTIADLFGLNPTVCGSLSRAASVAAGLATCSQASWAIAPSRTVGVTALGITAKGVSEATEQVRELGLLPTIFHANGFGGNAFALRAKRGEFLAVIDFTMHEVSSLLFDQQTQVSSDRLTCSGAIPRVLVPGGVNFFTKGPAKGLEGHMADRPHYSHSPDFTHVSLTASEMSRVGKFVARAVNVGRSPTSVVIPMGGFSSEDRTGGAIENEAGRIAFATALREIDGVRMVNAHINDRETVSVVIEEFERVASLAVD